MPNRSSTRTKRPRASSSLTDFGTGCAPISLAPAPRKSIRKLRRSSRDNSCFVTKLPDEIILEIFYFCIASPDALVEFSKTRTETATYHDLTDLRTSPLNISQVCGRWRRIALSSTSLWSIVVLHTDVLHSRHFHALDLWLSRSQSKSTPLVISLTICDEQQSKAVAHLFLNQFIKHSKRLKTVHLRLHYQIFDHLDTSMFNGPALEELMITCITAHPTNIPLTRSPRLKRLKLLGQLHFSFRSLEGLQYLDLDLREMPSDFFGVLGRLPSLESLIIKSTYWLLPEPSNTSIPRLRSLSLRSGLTVESSFVFLGHLFEVAPSLSHLELSCALPYSPLRWRQLISITERRKPPLVKLTFAIDSENDYVETDAPEAGFLATLLRSTPNLASLSSNYGTSETFVRAMTLQSATDLKLCPRLEEVHFGRFSGAVTAHCLVNMIVSRTNTGEKALKRVKLTPFHYHDISRRRVIKMSMSRGLELTSTMTK